MSGRGCNVRPTLPRFPGGLVGGKLRLEIGPELIGRACSEQAPHARGQLQRPKVVGGLCVRNLQDPYQQVHRGAKYGGQEVRTMPRCVPGFPKEACHEPRPGLMGLAGFPALPGRCRLGPGPERPAFPTWGGGGRRARRSAPRQNNGFGGGPPLQAAAARSARCLRGRPRGRRQRQRLCRATCRPGLAPPA